MAATKQRKKKTPPQDPPDWPGKCTNYGEWQLFEVLYMATIAWRERRSQDALVQERGDMLADLIDRLPWAEYEYGYKRTAEHAAVAAFEKHPRMSPGRMAYLDYRRAFRGA